MRFGIRTALSVIVLGCILISAGVVHGLWHRTADANSRSLAAALNRQITAAVRGELTTRINDAQSAFGAVRTILVQNVIDSREADKREFVFLSQIQAQPALSWVAFGWPDGAFFASHKLGDRQLEMVEILSEHGVLRRRIDRYRVYADDIAFQQRSFVPAGYDVRDQPWFQAALTADEPSWFFVNTHPGFKRGALAYAGPIDVYGERQGVLAVMIDFNRLSRFISALPVGLHGGAFILSPDGSIVAGPDPQADEVMAADFSKHPLLAVVRDVGERLAAAADTPPHRRVTVGGLAYDVNTAPLGFRDWRLAVILPEDEFLGEIGRTTTQLIAGLAVFVVAAALVSVAAARRLIGQPLQAIAGDLLQVERFLPDRIPYRPSRLSELDALSSALVRMANGLAAFGKYIPRDLVRTLVAEGVEAKPGGAMRSLTILFTDLEGFTGLSERLKADIVPLMGAYLEAVSQAVESEGGTVDKFIGDAVMAFWGAPRPNPDHALAACRAALAAVRAVRELGLTNNAGAPLRMRIGINTGLVLVGNVGSPSRLNYTVLGDAMNVASRL